VARYHLNVRNYAAPICCKSAGMSTSSAAQILLLLGYDGNSQTFRGAVLSRKVLTLAWCAVATSMFIASNTTPGERGGTVRGADGARRRPCCLSGRTYRVGLCAWHQH